jgi:PAS domain S-box-containing protein
MQPDFESKTKEEILQELRNYRTIFEVSGASIAILEDDATISSVNKAFEKLFGYSKEEFEGKQKWTELCVAEDRDRINNYHRLRRVEPTRAPHNYEARFIHKNGSFIDAYVTAALIPETKKSILDLIDISDLKRAEEALRKSNEERESRGKERTAELEKLNEALQTEAGDRKRAEDSFREANAYLENLINYANAPIIVWDPDFKIIRFNQAFERLTGYRTVDVIGKSLETLFPDAQKEESMSLIHSTTSGKRWEVVEIAIAHIDGTVRTVLWNSATLFAEDGVTIISTIAQGQDITERKRAEDSFREANAYLENLINYANAPIIVWDPDFKIIRFNQAFERLTGYRTVDVIGKSLETLFPDAQKEESMSLIHSTTSGKRWEVVEIAIAHIDGTVRTVLWNSATLFAEDGVTIISTIAQGQDITERKRAEEIVSRQSKEILEIATPVLQVWERIVAAPLIGTLDSMRTQQLMEQLLQRIVETNSLVALIDVTGVPAIDTLTAQHLIETISAVRLLGAQVVLTGIRPAIAQTLVHLGIDLSNVNTCSSLSTGLGYALDLLKMQVVHKA